MAYCGPVGLPYSEFREWSDLDQSAALAWRLRENQRCGACGTVPSEWKLRDWNGDPIYDEHGNQYLTRELPFHVVEESCPCCKAIDAAEKQGRPPGKQEPPKGRIFGMRPNPAASPVDRPD